MDSAGRQLLPPGGPYPAPRELDVREVRLIVAEIAKLSAFPPTPTAAGVPSRPHQNPFRPVGAPWHEQCDRLEEWSCQLRHTLERYLVGRGPAAWPAPDDSRVPHPHPQPQPPGHEPAPDLFSPCDPPVPAATSGSQDQYVVCSSTLSFFPEPASASASSSSSSSSASSSASSTSTSAAPPHVPKAAASWTQLAGPEVRFWRALYRSVVRQVHPDRCSDPAAQVWFDAVHQGYVAASFSPLVDLAGCLWARGGPVAASEAGTGLLLDHWRERWHVALHGLQSMCASPVMDEWLRRL